MLKTLWNTLWKTCSHLFLGHLYVEVPAAKIPLPPIGVGSLVKPATPRFSADSMGFDPALGCTFTIVGEVRRRGEPKEWVERGIRCSVCGMTSWSQGDIQNRWCHKCQKFHRRADQEGNTYPSEAVFLGEGPTPEPVPEAHDDLDWIDDLLLD